MPLPFLLGPRRPQCFAPVSLDSEEDRKKYLDEAMTARAQRFDAIVPLVRLQDEAMEIIARKLAIARKVAASPYLLYHMHGVAAPAGTASGPEPATAEPPPPPLSAKPTIPLHPRGRFRGVRPSFGSNATSEDEDEDGTDEETETAAESVATFIGWRNFGKARLAIAPGGVSESKRDDSRAEPKAASAPLLPPDPRAEYEIAVERRRLDTLILACEPAHCLGMD